MINPNQTPMSSFAVFKLLLPLYLAVAVGPLNTSGGFNLIPVFSDNFGVSLSLAGLAITLYMLPFVISQVMSGAVTEMLGARRALFVGFFIFSTSCLIAAVAPSFPSFLVARAIQGLGGGLILPVSMAMAAEQVPSNRTATAIGSIQAAFALGLALGPVTSGLFAGQLDWRAFYFFLAGAGVIAGGVVAIAYPRRLRQAGWRNPLRPVLLALSVSSIRVVSLAGTLSFLANVGVFIFVAVWLQRSALTGPVGAGLLISIPGVVGIFIAPMAGSLGDKWGDHRLISFGIVLFVTGILGIIALPDVVAVYPIFLVLIGIGGATLMTNMAALVLALRPDLRQAVAGVFNGSRFLGLMLGPVILTPVYEALSIRGVLIVAALILLAVAVILRSTKRELYEASVSHVTANRP
jgi:predicted MFS family arabinose efflux permease